jgi:hypothetical protein
MRRFGVRRFLFFVFVFVFAALTGPFCARSDAPTMTKEELRPHVSTQDFIIIDVRTSSDWKKSEYKMKGALREEPDAVKDWAGKYPKDKIIVLYCA